MSGTALCDQEQVLLCLGLAEQHSRKMPDQQNKLQTLNPKAELQGLRLTDCYGFGRSLNQFGSVSGVTATVCRAFAAFEAMAPLPNKARRVILHLDFQ